MIPVNRSLPIFALLFFASMSYAACIGATANFSCGDTVTESCVLNESMTIDDADCLLVSTADVEIDCAGFTISTTTSGKGIAFSTGMTTPAYGVKNCVINSAERGISLVDSNNVMITNVNVTADLQGILIDSASSNVNITSSSFVSASDNAIAIASNGGYVFDVEANTTSTNAILVSNDVSILNSRINTGGAGIEFDSGGINGTFENNVIFSADNAILLAVGADGNYFSNNSLNVSNGNTVLDVSSSGNTFLGNTFITDAGSGGKWVSDSGDGNFYNDSDSGNIYYYFDGTPSWDVYSILTASPPNWATSGADRPFNASLSGSEWSGFGEDWFPWTGNASTATITVNTVDMTPAYMDKGTQDVVCWVNATSTENTTMKFWYNVGVVGGANFNDGYGFGLPNDTRTDIFALAMAAVNLSNTPQVVKGDQIFCNVTVESPEGTGATPSFFSDNYTINDFNTTVYQNITETPTGAHKATLMAKFFDWDNDFDANGANVTNGSCDFILAVAVNNINTVRFNCTVDTGKNMTVAIWQNDTSGFNVSTALYVTDGPAACPGAITENTTMSEDCFIDTAPGYTIATDDVTLNCAGFHIYGSNGTDSAIYVNGASRLFIKNCIISNQQYGIFANGMSLSTLQNNTIGPTLLSGIYLNHTTNSLVLGGEIKDANTGTPQGTGWEAGIALAESSTDNGIRGVYMHNDRQGAIWIYEGSNNTHISANNINDNCGFIRQIRCDDSLETNISDNNITNGTGMGIEMYNCDFATVIGNTITGNAFTGIALSGVDDSDFDSNVVSNNNGSGISMVSSTFNDFLGLTATANQGWGIYVALGGNNTFENIMLSGNEMGSIGLVNTGVNEFYNTASTGYPGEFNIYLANASDSYFHNLTATSTTTPTIDIRDGSMVNTFVNTIATASASQAVFINSNSNANEFIASSLTGNSTYGSARVNASSRTYFLLSNFTAATGNDYNMYISNGAHVGMMAANIFRGGTTLIGFTADSDDNTICLNDFNTTATYYVTDATAGGNHYVCTYLNESDGNIWGDVLDGTVRIFGTVPASLWFVNYYIGSSGPGYPYSSATSAKVIGVTDTAPLTLLPGSYSPTNSSTNSLLSLIGILVVVALLMILISMEVTIENLVIFMLLAIIVIQLMLPVLTQGLVT